MRTPPGAGSEPSLKKPETWAAVGAGGFLRLHEASRRSKERLRGSIGQWLQLWAGVEPADSTKGALAGNRLLASADTPP